MPLFASTAEFGVVIDSGWPRDAADNSNFLHRAPELPPASDGGTLCAMKIALISRGLTASFAKANVPPSRISRAPRRKAPRAARQTPLPTLTRLTPIAERAARLS